MSFPVVAEFTGGLIPQKYAAYSEINSLFRPFWPPWALLVGYLTHLYQVCVYVHTKFKQEPHQPREVSWVCTGQGVGIDSRGPEFRFIFSLHGIPPKNKIVHWSFFFSESDVRKY
jgi:hypothetical protein